MKKTLFFLFITFNLTLSKGQDYLENRYQKSVFTEILSINNIEYGIAPVWTIPYQNQDLKLNVYVPNGDNNAKRPLIIFAHAGGFINGSKDVDNMVALCDSFAKKGFVTASIDYRKGFNPTSGGSSERAVYRAIQDGKTAVRYFKTHASLYDIDTNYVFFGGMSAGGFIANHVGSMDKETERPLSTYSSFGVNDLGCLDCGSHTDASSSVKGVLNYWGAVQDTSIIEENTPPMLLMHGENDLTVPFIYGNPFGVITLPEVYGSQPIKERLDNIGVAYEFVTSTGPLHMLDGSNNGTWDPNPNSFWEDTLLPETTSFIYNLIKPNTTLISPQTSTVCLNETITLEISESSNSHFIWNYNTNNINTITNTNSNSINLQPNTIGTYNITVIEFNNILCAGDTLEFTINVESLPNSEFTFNQLNNSEFAFTNYSTPGTTYLWDFGDGQTSTEENPIHVYNENGDYTVSLTSTFSNGCVSETFTDNISIVHLNTTSAKATDIIIRTLFTHSINIANITLQTNFEIYDISGQLVFNSSKTATNILIDTKDWSSGIYILKYRGINREPHQLKIIKT